MRFEDGSVRPGTLRVRFGEVEQRGIALTPAGRDLIEGLGQEIDVWRAKVPSSETDLLQAGLGYFRFTAAPKTELTSVHHYSVTELVRSGALKATPIVYEDFLPRSPPGSSVPTSRG